MASSTAQGPASPRPCLPRYQTPLRAAVQSSDTRSGADAVALHQTRPGVGRGNRRPGENDRRSVSEWRKIWADGLPDEGQSSKPGHRMAADGMRFPWRSNGSMIFTDLDVIWGMSVKIGAKVVRHGRYVTFQVAAEKTLLPRRRYSSVDGGAKV